MGSLNNPPAGVTDFADLDDIQVARKSSDTTVNNSIVLVNATDLVFAVAANEVWYWWLNLLLDSAAAADMRVAWTIPALATGVWGAVLGGTGATAMEGSAILTPDGQGAGITAWMRYHGVVFNGANVGNVQLQFAQKAANASDTKVLTDTSIIATKLA